MTTTTHSPTGRLDYFQAVASLSKNIQESPSELNEAVVEFLDLLASWVFKYHPTISEPDLFYIDESKVVYYRSVSTIEARERLRLLGDALDLVITIHPGCTAFDVAPLSAIPESHEIDIELGTCRDGGMALGQQLLAFHGQATRLLTQFQKVHAYSGGGPTAVGGDPPAAPRPPAHSRKRGTVNQRLLEMMINGLDEVMELSASKVALKLGCSESTVKGSEAWGKLMKARHMAKLTSPLSRSSNGV